MKKRKNKVSKHINCKPKPLPIPTDASLGTGLVFLAASFFNNTEAFELEHVSKDSRFALRYRGFGYNRHRRKRH